MKKIKDYIVLDFGDSGDLQEAVNSAIEDDYIPVGGVSVCCLYSSWENERKGYTESSTEYTYTQAMAKYFDA